MTSYSPTQTTRWLECPRKRALYRDGVRARGYGKRELAAILGQGIGAGLEAYNRARLTGEEVNVETCVAVGQARVAAEFAALDAAGRGLDPRDQAQRDAVPMRVAKGLAKYIADDPVPAEWRVVDVEQVLNGGARPDLVIDDGRGPCPLDYKTKLTLKPEYEGRELERWRVSWQLMHYTAALRAAHYYVCLIVLEPRFRTRLVPYEVPAGVLDDWQASAERVWQTMALEDLYGTTPWMAATHADVYGPCEYVDWCFGNAFDRERGFVNVKRGEAA